MNKDIKVEAVASILINLHIAPTHICVLKQARSASTRRPRTNLGRQLVLKKNFNYNAYAKLIILTHEQGARLFSSLESSESLMFKITDLSDESEMEMGVLYLDFFPKIYIISPGWEAYVIKHERPSLGVVWFYKEFDIWGSQVKYLIKFVKLKGITRSLQGSKTEGEKDDNVHEKSGGSCSGMQQHKKMKIS